MQKERTWYHSLLHETITAVINHPDKSYIGNVINAIIQLRRVKRGMPFVSGIYFKEGI